MIRILAAAGLVSLAMLGPAGAQVAGSTTLGVTITETKAVAEGWSVRRQILGETLANDKGDKIGKVEDVIVGPDGKLTFAIVDVGGFLGMGEHRVAVPVSTVKEGDRKAIIAGATKESLKALPTFKYAH